MVDLPGCRRHQAPAACPDLWPASRLRWHRVPRCGAASFIDHARTRSVVPEWGAVPIGYADSPKLYLPRCGRERRHALHTASSIFGLATGVSGAGLHLGRRVTLQLSARVQRRNASFTWRCRGSLHLGRYNSRRRRPSSAPTPPVATGGVLDPTSTQRAKEWPRRAPKPSIFTETVQGISELGRIVKPCHFPPGQPCLTSGQAGAPLPRSRAWATELGRV